MMTLHRRDPTRNMRRFYRTYVTATLFGEWAVVCEWGRIGHGGTVRRWIYRDPQEADTAQARRVRQKLRRGYVVVPLTRMAASGNGAGISPLDFAPSG